jgi:hypothetical protein
MFNAKSAVVKSLSSEVCVSAHIFISCAYAISCFIVQQINSPHMSWTLFFIYSTSMLQVLCPCPCSMHHMLYASTPFYPLWHDVLVLFYLPRPQLLAFPCHFASLQTGFPSRTELDALVLAECIEYHYQLYFITFWTGDVKPHMYNQACCEKKCY